MRKDLNYYQKEGTIYSSKRYPAIETDFVHFFFKRRLAILLKALRRHLDGRANLSFMEVGCADGIVARAMVDALPELIGSIVAVDVSSQMIDEARAQTKASNIAYYVRGQEPQGLYDVVVEVGVVNLTDRFAEYDHALKVLKTGGLYVCSLASKTSLRSRLKFNKATKDGFNHLLSFSEYEKELSQRFEIVQSIPFGLFIPLIWKIPAFARVTQPVLDKVLVPFASLFHEKIYVLRKR